MHQPVLLKAAIEMLEIQADGIYVDGTFGRGGHTAGILSCLGPQGRLYAIDRDCEAVQWGYKNFSVEPRFVIQHGAFNMLKRFCENWDILERVNGVLLDLGLSSPQLDTPARGFSFMNDGPLDMRMDTSQGLTAADWLASAEERELSDIFWRYGEERYSRRIARKIVLVRDQNPIKTTRQLADLIASLIPKKTRDNKHPATRVFQAIRIFVNKELSMLESVLDQAMDVLAPKGRLVVISFHSLEDRIVKRFMRKHAKGEPLLPRLPIQSMDEPQLKLIGKPVKADLQEIEKNVRARSAIMRVAEKIR